MCSSDLARHLVRHGGNGFVCPPSPEELAGAIALALESGPDMAEECHAIARAFSWEASAAMAERVLGLAVGSRFSPAEATSADADIISAERHTSGIDRDLH